MEAGRDPRVHEALTTKVCVCVVCVLERVGGGSFIARGNGRLVARQVYRGDAMMERVEPILVVGCRRWGSFAGTSVRGV